MADIQDGDIKENHHISSKPDVVSASMEDVDEAVNKTDEDKLIGHLSQSGESVEPTVGSVDGSLPDDVSSQSVASSVTDSMAESTTATIGSSIHGADSLTTTTPFPNETCNVNSVEDEQPTSETPEPIVGSSEPDHPNTGLDQTSSREEGVVQQTDNTTEDLVQSLNELSGSLTEPGQQLTPEALAAALEQQSQQQFDSSSAIQGSNEVAPLPFMLESQVIMVNGEQHTIISQGIDESTGEQLVILESASGSQFALPLSTLTGSLQADDGQQLPQDNQQQSEQQILNQEQDLVGQALVQDVASTMIDGLANIAVNQQALQQNDNNFANVNGGVTTEGTDSHAVSGNQATSVVDSNGQALVAGGIVSDSSGNQFVIMTEGVSDAAGQQINLTDVMQGQVTSETSNAGSFMLEDQGMKDVSSHQIISEGPPLTSHEEAIIQAVTASGNLTEGQVIHCVSEGVTMAYQIGSASNGELSLIQLGPVDAKQSPVKRGKRYGDSMLGSQHFFSSSVSKKKQPIQSSLSVSKTTPGRTPINKVVGTDISITRVTNTAGKVLPKVFPYSSAENSSLLTGSLPGPSQLASSRKTYSRKNIVWVNSEANDAAKSIAVPAIVSTNDSMSVTSAPAILHPKKSMARAAVSANTTSPTETITRVSKKIEVVQTKKLHEEPKKKTPEKKEVVVEAKVDTNGEDVVTEAVIEENSAAAFGRKGRRRTTSSSESKGAVVPESPSKAVIPPAKQESSPRRGGRPKKAVQDLQDEVVEDESASVEPVVEEAVEKIPAVGRGRRKTNSPVASVEEAHMTLKSPEMRIKTSETKTQEAVATPVAEETGIRRSGRASKRKVEEDFVDPDVELSAKRGSRKSVKITENVVLTTVTDNHDDIIETEDTVIPTTPETGFKTGKRVSMRRPTASSEEDKPVEKKRKSVTIQEPEESTPKKSPSKSSSPAATTSAYSSPVSPSKKLTPILKQTNYKPRGKRLAEPLVCTFSPLDVEKQNKELRQSIDNLDDSRNPDQRYDIDSPECSIHVRQQSPSLRSTPGVSCDTSYTCQKCGFHTSRMYILVRHHKEECPAIKNAWMHIWQNEIKNRQQSQQ